MTFHGWLMKNRWRADPIGDLARDAWRDQGWPRRGKAVAEFRAYLVKRGSCPSALRALRRAWTEYQLFTEGVAWPPAMRPVTEIERRAWPAYR